jgi:hypothetical protein
MSLADNLHNHVSGYKEEILPVLSKIWTIVFMEQEFVT